jgi:hypothetical protein
MSDGRVYRPSAPVNVSREMGEYYNREAARVMGYRFERPSSNGLVIRKPTPEERKARDTAIDALREARGERVARAAPMMTDAYFAEKRKLAVAALKRAAARKRGSGKRKGGEG